MISTTLRRRYAASFSAPVLLTSAAVLLPLAPVAAQYAPSDSAALFVPQDYVPLSDFQERSAGTTFDLLVCAEQRITLTFQLARHLVEYPTHHGDFVVALLFWNADIQIPGADALRRTG